ncbi:hypothetical protein [Bradyrhizobium sp. LHD-71]|uniref:hypothetical protein n=1 Tax=Bradyrhizobium sp. LHD-71 TaxID=3072141 RepID=UPI00280DD380|nr:hypothetical protein [Bradyrhizobium sp. LHD-71]MDQ8730344.1 hypothetical protein [Bradyrhizobium sp. LHD-71]
MKHDEQKPARKNDHAAIILVGLVVLSLLTTFSLLYALTPPTVATVESQYSLKQE